ncbi:alpha/beta fold hydrolase [Microlunatus parietis]|uniref:AB hydrolase-1 domain-containing protein n=1 Tax=Microlunatus parietis TaxID=682979 RepID=A0A7Y9LDK6_9ACTN|nr:alpha/beta hydrolase [Microlunatus parietis]NYE72900.1 hypothetical protein [Microlunatus parietis]
MAELNPRVQGRDRMNGQFTRDGYVIHFETTGTGPRLIWVDPALGSSAMRPMEAALEMLTSRFEVVTYDRRGRGLNREARPSARDEIDDLAGLVAHLGGADIVTGFSSGGALVLRAARHLRPATIALVEPAVSDARDGSGLRERIDQALAAGAPETAVRAFYDATGTPEEIIRTVVESPAWKDVVRCASTLPAELDLTEVTADTLAAVPTPIHVIISDGSPPEITGMGETLVSRADATLWREPGSWHGIDPTALTNRLTSLSQSATENGPSGQP